MVRSPYMHSEVNSVYVLYLKVFSKLRNLQKFRSWSRGLSEMMATEYRVSVRRRCKSETEKKRERRRVRGKELGEDAFILPTGNNPPNNTCISSTPVAHRLSSKGTRKGGCRARASEARGMKRMGEGGREV